MKIYTVLTTKNRPLFFKHALQSAINQTKLANHIIIVSDSNPANTAIEKESIEGIANLTYLKNQYSKNYAGSLNTAIHHLVNAELIKNDVINDNIYIAFLDDDDIWNDDYLFKCSQEDAHNDFIVTGLIRVTEQNKTPLSIPSSININDFLMGNPHIQGSNTFIRLTTLLKAGGFDENLPSTTDRDLFVRVMMLQPTYSIIKEHLVEVDATDNRARITNTFAIKKEGLQKFYYKYSKLMSNDIKTSFFDRALTLFNLPKTEFKITPIASKPAENWSSYPKYLGQLTIGIIITEYELGVRLVKQLAYLNRPNLDIIIIANYTCSSDSLKNLAIYFNKLTIISLDKIKNDYANGRLPHFIQSFKYKDIITDIAISRSVLNYYLYQTNVDGYIWILDDDMELSENIIKDNVLTSRPIDIDRIISKYENSCDAIVGGYSNDPPLPTLSILRKSLLDYTYTYFSNALPVSDQTIDDYYYDLSDNSRKSLETPTAVISPSLYKAFSGKAISRPLYSAKKDSNIVRGRGGNTIIFNKKLLLIPNLSIDLGEFVARRGDFFWVQQVIKSGFKILSGNFSLKQTREITPFNFNKELKKLIKDLVGSSFTKAYQDSIDSKTEITNHIDYFFDKYQSHYNNRVTLFILSLFRIQGLLSILKQYENIAPFEDEFKKISIESIAHSLKKYRNPVSIRVAYNKLIQTLQINQRASSQEAIKIVICQYFKCGPLRLLGMGAEGIVYTDNSFVYKYFWTPPGNLNLLEKFSPYFRSQNFLYPFDIFNINNNIVLRYQYEPKLDDFTVDIKTLIAMIHFCEKQGVIFNNIKKSNFIRTVSGQLKFIDYGSDLISFTPPSFQKMKERIYHLLKYNLSEIEFKQLIFTTYLSSEKNKLLATGIESLELLLKKRGKESIHDQEVIDLIREINPNNILDYGAGKCKIANALSTNYTISVFDVDKDILEKRCNKSISIIKELESVSPDSYDLINSNLVLCSVNHNTVLNILSNIVKLLKVDGYLTLSICNPIFNPIKTTETRDNANSFSYSILQKIQKTLHIKDQNGNNIQREEYHRTLQYYISTLKKFGFKIRDIRETSGVDATTLLPISEHLIFKCQLHIKPIKLSHVSLLIKTNPMEHNEIYDNIKHITSQLEQGIQFAEKAVVVDNSDVSIRTRQYQTDNKQQLIYTLNQAIRDGLIDKVIYSPNDTSSLSVLSSKYFNIQNVKHPHSQNGQAILASLHGFDSINTQFVFQTDSDMLYYCPSYKALQLFFTSSLNLRSVTSTMSIARTSSSHNKTFGNRVEVRSSLLNLPALFKQLPLPNKIDSNGQLLQPWHRALDNKLLNTSLSVRHKSPDLFYIHPENTQKVNDNFLSIVQQQIENIEYLKDQIDSINLIGEINQWSPKTGHEVVVFIRGYNTPPSKLKRLLDSLSQQSIKDFQIIYIDDASTKAESKDYIRYRLQYTTEFLIKPIIIFNKTNKGGLYNLNFALKNIVNNPNATIICIDNDDYLINNNAIQIILSHFHDGAEVTIGGCFRKDKPLKEYHLTSFKQAYKRNGDNIWLHPKCFKKYLYDQLDLNDLKINNQFVNVNQDFALMLPLIEISKKNIFIKDILYYFEPSVDNQNKQGKHAPEYKNHIKNILLDRAKERYEKNNLNYR